MTGVSTATLVFLVVTAVTSLVANVLFMSMWASRRPKRDTSRLKDGDVITRSGKVYGYSRALGWLALSRAQIASLPNDKRDTLRDQHLDEVSRNWWDSYRDLHPPDPALK